MKKILVWLFFIILLTSSFDIFFNLNLGGFNIRTCYLTAFAFILIYSIAFKDAHRFRFIGSFSFLIWTFFIIAFIYNTQFIARNVGYVAWLFFNILVCYSIYKISEKISTAQLMRLYIISFLLIAIAGILQFIFSSLGIHILVTSWWEFNRLPRVNGFSYEPSYFATYLLIGFVLVYHLTKKEVYIFSRKQQIYILLSLSLAVLLSTSRMGILFIIIIVFYDLIMNLLKSFWTLRISRINLVIFAFFIFGFLGTIVKIALDDKLRNRFLAGTGIESTASHSRDARIKQMTNVYDVFIDSPIEGYSLGGIAPAIAKKAGAGINDQKKAKEFEGLNIFLEVLAASGIFGFLFFVYWLFKLFKCNIVLSKQLKEMGFHREGILLDSLKLALVSELLILILSQNILRPYLWILIGMTNAVYFRLKYLAYPTEYPTEFNTEIELKSE